MTSTLASTNSWVPCIESHNGCRTHSTILAIKANISLIKRDCCLSYLSNQVAMLAKFSRDWVFLEEAVGAMKGIAIEGVAPWGEKSKGSVVGVAGSHEVTALSCSSNWTPSLFDAPPTSNDVLFHLEAIINNSSLILVTSVTGRATLNMFSIYKAGALAL
ncbi:hypothetical protein HAX54_051582 [Datura stramonium]|uniref:Uncharacterized protein n=1 Tax=Datura stramonium TaxID=4076 RepID=A0ABS8WML0_DATST|nr:hypothetical protein [Datura stramonium]